MNKHILFFKKKKNFEHLFPQHAYNKSITPVYITIGATFDYNIKDKDI